MNISLYEDTLREGKQKEPQNRYSPYCDLICYESSVTPGLKLAMLVRKPQSRGHIIATTHGWHMSLPKFDPASGPVDGPYLWVHVDMRGRPYSLGKQDCNGLELIDVLDAVEHVKRHYADYLIDTETVYFEGGSGGGGNAMAIAAKFPDYFAAITALCGISDYARWYAGDQVGEFRDEMDAWIGCSPADDPMAYAARSGLAGAGNLMAPIFIAHGESDERVPVSQSRDFVASVQAAGKGSLVSYLELANVGTQSHWGRATEPQMSEISRLSEENRLRAPSAVTLPDSGELTILGYLYTKRFIVMLDSIGKVARINYDLKNGTFAVQSPVPCGYVLRVL